MKKIIWSLLALTLCLTILAGCSFFPEEIKFCEVQFYVDGELYTTKTVVIGQSVATPQNPEKENFVFTGWRVDGVISYMFDFSSKIMGDTELHACFTPDAVAITNMIATQTLKSTVAIKNKCYNATMGGFIDTEILTSYGSGVVVDISGGYAYVLTNAHVARKETGFSLQEITVEDPWGKEYEAKIYKNPGKNDEAISEEYDLALICFKYLPDDDEELLEITLGDDPELEDFIVAIGNPGGLQNTVTYGYALGYQKIQASEGSSITKVTFDILVHNAPIDHGSSGGALVDAYGRLVGINFAGYNDGTYGCTIPISKVVEFMNLFVY